MSVVSPPSPATAGNEALTGKRVLVVDDLESMRRIVSTHLRKSGAADVWAARTGEEALGHLQAEVFDVVLCAWNLEEMSGLELLKAIRSDQRLCHLPVVLTTAEPDRELIAQAIAHGVSALLVKPFSLGGLTERVVRALTWVPVENAGGDGNEDPEPVVEAPRARPVILLVDDVADDLHLLSGLFKGDCKVRVAPNGEKALSICHSEDPPDLVLLDIMMPGMDGFEVARRMREHPQSETIPIVFVTAMVTEEARQQGMELGAVDFVTKPIEPSVLVPRVRNFLRYVQLRKHLQADYDNMLEMARLRDVIGHITRQDVSRPLTGIVAMLRSLMETGNLGRREMEQVRAAAESARHALDVITLSTELIKIETGGFRLDPVPVPIGEILRRVAEIARGTFQDRNLSIAVDTDVLSTSAIALQVSGDAVLCHSVFHNLLMLACEMAPGRSRLEIAVADTDPLLVTIGFRGKLSAEERDRFFERSAVSIGAGEAGLAAYSARLQVQAQHGSISLQAGEDETIVFEVRLPRHHPDPG